MKKTVFFLTLLLLIGRFAFAEGEAKIGPLSESEEKEIKQLKTQELVMKIYSLERDLASLTKRVDRLESKRP